ncbi:MAG: hypothetical protein DRO88_04720, partial [Promethearchaeia archaeon]
WLGSFFGIIASIAYVGIGFTPWDLNLIAHMWCVYIAFPVSLPLTVCYIIGIYSECNLPKRMAISFFGYLFILSFYLYLLFFGPASATETGRMIQVVGQKIIIYATNLLMIFQKVRKFKLNN